MPEIYSNIHTYILSVLFGRPNGIRIGVSTINPSSIPFNSTNPHTYDKFPSIPHIPNIRTPIPQPPKPIQRSPKSKPTCCVTPATKDYKLNHVALGIQDPSRSLHFYINLLTRHARNLHHERRTLYYLLPRTCSGRSKDRRRHYRLGEEDE
ncbi:hypothetical protein ACN38_g5419 [Penicillium nordicum]|uniref:VOC domain-containing protein n=1 Tax=Penicillium nordicum TaxID=229535 RepID=A0A0M9WG90_9EURO|nr:hypothetical protein ACN38_g5419 [Penicillium nordicum]